MTPQEKILSGIPGCHVDSEDAPEWSRKIARESKYRLEANARCCLVAEDMLMSSVQGSGKGKRAVNFRYAMKIDPTVHTGSQSYNNCTSWATRECVGDSICTDMLDELNPKRSHEYPGKPGTAAIYGNRGSGADAGMSIEDGVDAVHTIGIGIVKQYPGFDLSDQGKDEQQGVRWGRTGVPKEFADLIGGDKIEQVSYATDVQAACDLLYMGHFCVTGSTRTAASTSGLVSNLKAIGGHAQALIGYDQTPEFLEWLAKTTGEKPSGGGVAIFDQSWGDWLSLRVWPDHLWGPRPEGAWVIDLADLPVFLNGRFGSAIFMNRVLGFQAKKLPDWGTSEYL